MSLKTVSRLLLIAVALVVTVQSGEATVQACKCGADTREYQILKKDDGSVAVRVWLVNTCRIPYYVLANVVATATDDGALLKEDYPVRLNKYTRTFVDVPFDEEIDTVVYWYATRLGAGAGFF